MRETIPSTHPTAIGPGDRRMRPVPGTPVFPGETARLILLAIAAAVLTGLLALPFTMPGGALAQPPATLGAFDPVADIGKHPA